MPYDIEESEKKIHQKFLRSILHQDPSSIQVFWSPYSSYCVALLTEQPTNKRTRVKT